jgi:lipoyl(octanoyl) transferase
MLHFVQHDKNKMKELNVIKLGLTDYKSTWDLQKKIFDLRVEGKISDVVLLNEHHHVYTIGKSGNGNHLLASEEELRSKGAEVYYIDRGGDVTYHGPGQLVGYPILDLNTYYLDIHRYLRDLEEVIIRTLGEFGIKANRDSNFTGVWVGSEKIAAIGVKVSRWVTMHGFAFNVNTDLSYFDRIIPCGIFHKGVTSIEKLLGQQVPLDEVSQLIVKHFEEVFGVKSIEQLVTSRGECANFEVIATNIFS